LQEDVRAAGFVHDASTREFRQQNPSYTPPAPAYEPEPEPEDEFDEPTTNAIQRMVDKRVEAALQPLRPALAVASDSAFERQVKQAYPEADADLMTALRDLGYNTPENIAQFNPAHITIALDVVRGRRAGAPAPPPVVPAAIPEPDTREADIAAIASMGGGSGGPLPKYSDLDPDLRKAGKEQGLTEDQTVALADGPARIRIGGGK
jgi:hypothetical protein